MPLQKPLQDAAKKSGAYLGASSPAKHFTCTRTWTPPEMFQNSSLRDASTAHPSLTVYSSVSLLIYGTSMWQLHVILRWRTLSVPKQGNWPLNQAGLPLQVILQPPFW